MDTPTVVLASTDSGGTISGILLLVVVLIGAAVYITKVHPSKHQQQKEHVDNLLRQHELQRWQEQQAWAAMEESRRKAWEAQQAATPQYCDGCGTVKYGSEMVWTLDGVYRCRNCAYPTAT